MASSSVTAAYWNRATNKAQGLGRNRVLAPAPDRELGSGRHSHFARMWRRINDLGFYDVELIGTKPFV
jgi:hypothetical protein